MDVLPHELGNMVFFLGFHVAAGGQPFLQFLILCGLAAELLGKVAYFILVLFVQLVDASIQLFLINSGLQLRSLGRLVPFFDGVFEFPFLIRQLFHEFLHDIVVFPQCDHSNDIITVHGMVWCVGVIQLLLQMQLYNLPLNPSTAVLRCVYGNFSAPKSQEIILVKTKSLELYAISDQGKLELLAVEELFCVMRTAVAFRYHGTFLDSIVLGSDSGKLVILEYDEKLRRFRKTHEECFGKSGCRRIVPGQYIAVDPRGRALMVAAIQKQKFVYVLQRKEQKLFLHSPREAHKSHSICVDVVALDTGSDNAVFACIQMDYGEVEDKEAIVNVGGVRKAVVYYEMDFGMNTVIRKKEAPVDPTAHMLIAVPGGNEGPGGVIVVLEDYLLYRGGTQEHMLRFPLRKARPAGRKTQFSCHCIYRFKGFFFLVGSELGDLFKVEFLLRDNKDRKEVVSLKIEYFDTAAPLSSMALTKNGYLFCAAERQDHRLYLILSSEIDPIYTHSQMAQNNLVQFDHISPRKMLQATDCIEQYGPLTDLKVADLRDEGSPQIYAVTAAGEGNSCLRVIRQGLKVRQLNAIRYYQPQEIWCVKSSCKDEHDRMIVLSLASRTLILTTTPNGYSQTKDTGLDEESPTLHVGRLEDDSLVQVLPSGFRHIRKDKTARTMKFQGKIIKGTTRGRQMVLALAGGDIIYYELDQTGALSEVTQASLDSQVVAFDFSPVEKGRVRSSFLAAALSDFTTRIFQLSPDSCLRMLSTQNMRSAIEAIAIEEMATSEAEADRYGMQLYLYAGLQNGMVVRTSIDPITGKLTDSRPKYLGAKPVKLVKLQVLGRPAVLALSSRPWLFYTFGQKQMATLLAFPFISVAACIHMANFAHTIMVFSENHLRIISLENFGNIFHSDKIPLTYSAKKMLVFEKNVAVLESAQGEGKWHSQVSIFSGKEGKIVTKMEMEEDEACVSLCYCSTKEGDITTNFLLLGCVKSLKYYPSFTIKSPCIKVYEWDGKTNQARLFHETEVEDVPLVLYAWKDRILAGIGKCLRYYEVGRKRLLRKAQVKNLSSPINTIKTWGERIFATEVNDSFHMYKYKAREQTFYDIADDVLGRYVTTTAILDYHTMIGADKFENIFVSRVPHNAEEDFENNPNSYKFRWENGYLNGAPFKMEQICSFYVGEVVTSIEKAALATSGSEILIYSTINGGINALCPFETRQDVDFFTHLQLYMKNLAPSVGGRDHHMYRSYYTPCRSVVDGELCEVFNKLNYEEQVEIGKHLDRTPQEIQKKLQEIRNRLI